MESIIAYLTQNKETISTMESATGGYLASSITNISGSSLVFSYGAVTYSNKFKIKMGVKKEIIDKYSVYSMECANSMSKTITDFTNSDYGVGITGQLKKADDANPTDNDNLVYVSVYDRNKNYYYTMSLEALDLPRSENKKYVVNRIIDLLKTIV